MIDYPDITVDPCRRHEIVAFFAVVEGNPNGDPDNGNAPRMMPNGHGFITDVCIKRHIRNAWAAAGLDILIRAGVSVEGAKELAGITRIEKDPKAKAKKGAKAKPDDDAKADAAIREGNRQIATEKFIDVRIFGGMLAGDYDAGKMQGPLQFAFAHSIAPVDPMQISITRVSKHEMGEDEHGTFGDKWAIPGQPIYRMHGYWSPMWAAKSGVTPEDMEHLWTAMLTMENYSRSATRILDLHSLFVLSHTDGEGLGSAPASKVFKTITTTGSTVDDFEAEAITMLGISTNQLR